MTQYQIHTANTPGCAVLVLATENLHIKGVDDNALETASIAQCLSLNMVKEALGILQGEETGFN